MTDKRPTIEDVKQWPDSPMKRQIMAQLGEPIPTHHQEQDKPDLTPKPPKMTGPERKHAAYLDALLRKGEIISYFFEAVKVRLADRCLYLPDFFVVYADGSMGFEEIKGVRVWEDSIIKFKVAKDRYPWFRWSMYQYSKSGCKQIY